jgi:hypothetical protein
VAKIAELEVVARSQDDRITELETTCADFKCEKDKVTDATKGWQRNTNHLLKKPKKIRQILQKPMLPSSLSFT